MLTFFIVALYSKLIKVLGGKIVFSKFIIVAIVIVSISLSCWGFLKLNNKDDNKIQMLKILLGQVIPLLALLIPIFMPQEGTKILFPEMEKKIVENQKLRKELEKKDKLISKLNEEKDTVQNKNDDLSKKNYAALKKTTLVYDGLEQDTQASVSLVNNSVYVNKDTLTDLLKKDVTYNEDSNTLFVGTESEQITKFALSDDYSMLYSGKSYVNLGETKTKSKDTYEVAGSEIPDGFIIESSKYGDAYVLIKLDGSYSSIEFDVGKLDSSSQIEDALMLISLDDEEKNKETINSQIASTHYKFDTTGATTLKIELVDSYSSYGFYNVTFNK